MPVNPNAPVLTDASDRALVAEFGAMEAHDAAVSPDPLYVAHERELLTLLCTIYGAVNVAQAEEDAEDEHGGLLVQRPSLWRVAGCSDLTALADGLYGGGQ